MAEFIDKKIVVPATDVNGNPVTDRGDGLPNTGNTRRAAAIADRDALIAERGANTGRDGTAPFASVGQVVDVSPVFPDVSEQFASGSLGKVLGVAPAFPFPGAYGIPAISSNSPDAGHVHAVTGEVLAPGPKSLSVRGPVGARVNEFPGRRSADGSFAPSEVRSIRNARANARAGAHDDFSEAGREARLVAGNSSSEVGRAVPLGDGTKGLEPILAGDGRAVIRNPNGAAVPFVPGPDKSPILVEKSFVPGSGQGLTPAEVEAAKTKKNF